MEEATTDYIPLRRARIDVVALLRSSLDALERQAREQDVELRVDASGAIEASIDAEKIAWAVTALAGNALRYVHKGTRRMPGGSIVVSVRSDDSKQLTIAVQDDGPGIPKEKRDLLFVRARERARGAGLALMLVQDVLTAHRGTIDVASETSGENRGTTVTLSLPLS
jgi:signal transduction histidine kinase